MKRSRLNPQSEQLRLLGKIYGELVSLLAKRVWGRCARCQLPCDALDPHHPYKRGKGKSSWKLFVIVPVCRACHDAIHSDENQARADGWIIDPVHHDPYKL